MTERLGWTLIHFLWQGTVIAAIYAIARNSMARSSPRARYMLGCIALAAMVAAPLLTLSLHPSPNLTSISHAQTPTDVRTAITTNLANTKEIVATSPSHAYLQWVVIFWLAGATALWLRLIGGWILAGRMRSAQVRPAPPEWQQALDRLRAQIGMSRPVQLLISALVQVPTVIGWLRPVVLVPIGALTGLPPDQIQALLIHELAHIRRNDYLVNILQSVAEAWLFYHPAIWWISSHIRAEREQCCDDIAVAASGDVLAYARALADLESARPAQLTQAIAANGGSLSDRIGRLLGHSQPSPRTGAGAMILAGTIVLIVTATGIFGQSSNPQFEVASFKPSPPNSIYGIKYSPGGRFDAQGVPLHRLIEEAWTIRVFQIEGGPQWLGSDRYDIAAKAPGNATEPQLRLMLRALLQDRFHLTLHTETREPGVYMLVIGKNGSKLAEAKDDDNAEHRVRIGGPGRLGGFAATTAQLAETLSDVRLNGRPMVDRPVLDRTGLTGQYNFLLQWTPDAGGATLPEGPSIFTAIEEQLGLQLKSGKGSVEYLIVDHAEKPTAN